MAPSSPPIKTTLRRTSSPTAAQNHPRPASPTLALASASAQLVSPSPPPAGSKVPQHLLAPSPARSFSLNSPTTEYPTARVYDNAFTWERANQAATASGSGNRQHVPKPLHPPGQGQGQYHRPFDSPPSPTTPLPHHQQSSSTSKFRGVPVLPIAKANIFNNPNSSSTKVRTQAEVYADKHSQPQNRRQLNFGGAKEDLSASKDKDRPAGTTKPIFDWIQRKLGARRATISETPSSPKTASSPRARLPSIPKTNERVNNVRAFPGTNRGRGRGRGPGVKNGFGGVGHGHGYANGPGYGMTREDSGGISRADSRSVSMSLSTRSFVGTVERERRREANNPYPSIPIPRLAAAGMVNGHGQADDATTLSMSMSMSYLSRSPRSRSRSHSVDSLQTDGSRSRRLSLADEMESPVRRFRGRAFGGGGSAVGADDDASLRPFPPSHPASPTPSTSVLSRSGSNPMISLSNQQQPFGTITGPGGGTRSRTNTFYSTWSGQGHDRRSYTSSSLDGYAYRPSSAGYIYPSGYGGSRYDEHGTGDDDDEDEDDEERGRESRQDSTSTKPTTCISFDSGPAVGHIAQAHGASQDQTPSTPHTPMLNQGQGGAAVTVTASPSSIHHTAAGVSSANVSPRHVPRALSPSPPTSPADVGGSGNSSPTPPTPTTPTSPISAFPSPARDQRADVVAGPSSYDPLDIDHHHRHHAQAPKHTNPHPVHNPRPSSPPDDNASMLTLASSTFELPAPPSVTPGITNPPSIHRLRETPLRPPSVTSPSIHWAVPEERDQQRPTSTYETGYAGYAGSTHLSTTAPSVSMSLRQWSLGGDRGMNRADRDASVRAVRRKGSWESYESGWSWRGLSGPASASASASASAPGAGTGTIGESTVTPQSQTAPGGGWPRGLASPVAASNQLPKMGQQPPFVEVAGDQGAIGAVGGGSQGGSVYTRESWITAQSEVGVDDDDEEEDSRSRFEMEVERGVGIGTVMVS
ncbi:hypothetical protein IAT40_006929 [Kwoniella sp. CBS 6097]